MVLGGFGFACGCYVVVGQCGQCLEVVCKRVLAMCCHSFGCQVAAACFPFVVFICAFHLKVVCNVALVSYATPFSGAIVDKCAKCLDSGRAGVAK